MATLQLHTTKVMLLWDVVNATCHCSLQPRVHRPRGEDDLHTPLPKKATFIFVFVTSSAPLCVRGVSRVSRAARAARAARAVRASRVSCSQQVASCCFQQENYEKSSCS